MGIHVHKKFCPSYAKRKEMAGQNGINKGVHQCNKKEKYSKRTNCWGNPTSPASSSQRLEGGASLIFHPIQGQSISLSWCCSFLPYHVRIATMVPVVPMYDSYSFDDNCGYFQHTISTDNRPALLQPRKQRLCSACGKKASLAIVLSMLPTGKPSVVPALLPSRCPKP